MIEIIDIILVIVVGKVDLFKAPEALVFMRFVFPFLLLKTFGFL